MVFLFFFFFSYLVFSQWSDFRSWDKSSTFLSHHSTLLSKTDRRESKTLSNGYWFKTPQTISMCIAFTVYWKSVFSFAPLATPVKHSLLVFWFGTWQFWSVRRHIADDVKSIGVRYRTQIKTPLYFIFYNMCSFFLCIYTSYEIILHLFL